MIGYKKTKAKVAPFPYRTLLPLGGGGLSPRISSEVELVRLVVRPGTLGGNLPGQQPQPFLRKLPTLLRFGVRVFTELAKKSSDLSFPDGYPAPCLNPGSPPSPWRTGQTEESGCWLLLPEASGSKFQVIEQMRVGGWEKKQRAKDAACLLLVRVSLGRSVQRVPQWLLSLLLW